MFALGRRYFRDPVSRCFALDNLSLACFLKALLQDFRSTLTASSMLACCFELEVALVHS